MRRVVVLGGGFAGLHTVLELQKLLRFRPRTEIRLINRHPHLLFTPALPDVIAGQVDVGRAAVPIRRLLEDEDVALTFSAATGIDLEASRVLTEDGGAHTFDALVLAIGAIPDFRGVPGAREHTQSLKTLRHALELRTLLSRERTRQGAQESARVIIIGGGPEGVEVAASIAAAARRWNPTGAGSPATVTLVERGPRLVPDFHESLGEEAARALHELGVELCMGAEVEAVEAGRVLLSGGRYLNAEHILWCGGVKTPGLLDGLGLPQAPDGRVRVDEELRVAADELGDVYALGDIAASPHRDEALAPRRIEVAIQQASVVAQNVAADLIGRSRRPFRWKPQAELLSLGPRRSVARVKGFTLKGRVGWSADQAATAAMLPNLSGRLSILAEWGRGIFNG